MSKLLFYILSTGICLSLFVLAYQIFLRDNTRFNLCRFYLISAILLSFLIPSIPIDFGISQIYKTKHIVPQVVIEPIVVSSTQEIITNTPVKDDINLNIDYLSIISITLVSISLLLFVRFIYRFGSIILIQTSGNRLENDEGYNLIFTDKTDNAFSFLGNIFINPLKFNDEEKRLIIDHEREHIRHFHSIDLILIELLIVLQWFNPFAYIARRKLIEIHEFIADDGVIRNGADPHSYQNLLLSVVTSSCLPNAGNQLSAFITKKRIAMIGKPMNQTGRRINFLILIPIAVILIIEVSAFSPKKPIRLDTVKEKLTQIKQLEPIASPKEPNFNTVAGDNPIAVEIKNISSDLGKSTITNKNEENLEPLKRIEVKSLVEESSLIKETRINILPISQQDIKDELYKRAKAGIKDTYLKDFYFNFNLLPSGSSTNLSPNATTTRYSVILKKDCIYNLYYFSENKNDQLMAIIGSGNGKKSVIEQQFNFSYFHKKTFVPKLTGAYHLEINNLSSEKAEALMYLTLAEYKDKGSETMDKQVSNLDFTNKEHSKNNNVERVDTLNQVFTVVEKMPSFGTTDNDFRTWVASNLQYPKEAIEKGIQGRVYVQFIVAKDGSVNNPKIIRGVDPLLDAEAIRVISLSPKWNPGIQRGEPVNVYYTFPITFSQNKSVVNENKTDLSLVDDSSAYKGLEEKANRNLVKGVQRTDFFMNLNPKRFNMYTVSLKQGCAYNLYVFPLENEDQFHAVIYKGDFNNHKQNSIIERETDISYSNKGSFTPKQSGSYILSLENLSSKRTSVLMVVTSTDDKNVITEWAEKKEPEKDMQIINNEDEVFLVVEQMPSFGNIDNDFRTWVASNLKYPKEAADKGIQGRVYVQFIVAKDGSVKSPKVIRGANPLLDAEAMRIMNLSPKWNPGMQKGKPVNVSYTFPITFTLQ